MTDLARSFATEILDQQARVLDWQLAQSRKMEEQVVAGFASARAAAELSRDLSRNLGKTWLDAVLPAKKAE